MTVMISDKKIVLTKKDIYRGNLILVNRDFAIKEKTKRNQLEAVNEEYKDILISKEANKHLQAALKEIEANDQIVPVSGYRSLEEQIAIFDSSLIENGEEFTRKYVALPNCSEHQTGLAMDLGLNEGEIDFIRPAFPHEGICNQFRKASLRHGFIERYTEEKEAITNISSEEWHFRYVGYPHSQIMFEKNLCLEEYINYLKKYRYGVSTLTYEDYEISYVFMDKDTLELSIDEHSIISGNNVDGFIITRRK